jgi:hypothetical protein
MAENPVKVEPAVADALAGTWVGSLQHLVTLDEKMTLEFKKTSDGMVSGKLVGTNFGKVDLPLQKPRGFRGRGGNMPMIKGREIHFSTPQDQPWSFSGKLMADGTIKGSFTSIEIAPDALPVTFHRVSGPGGKTGD